MENWGLITGRTTGFLVDPGREDVGGKRAVASMVCHEISHMWFGNITTMEWWDSLFLNEGFATWVSPFTSLWITYRALNIERRVVDR